VVIHTEMGYIGRFLSGPRFASYAGTVATRHESGGKSWGGRVSKAANPYLKWAFVEAANAALLYRRLPANAHVVQLYDRVQAKRGHKKAIVAMARHLAEAAFWILTKQEPYKPPKSSTRG
jgi:transposase